MRSMVEGAGLLRACGHLPLTARFARFLPRKRGRKECRQDADYFAPRSMW
jgi:hypothetical protein